MYHYFEIGIQFYLLVGCENALTLKEARPQTKKRLY